MKTIKLTGNMVTIPINRETGLCETFEDESSKAHICEHCGGTFEQLEHPVFYDDNKAVHSRCVKRYDEHALLNECYEVLKRIETIPHFDQKSVESTRGTKIFEGRNKLADDMRSVLTQLQTLRTEGRKGV